MRATLLPSLLLLAACATKTPDEAGDDTALGTDSGDTDSGDTDSGDTDSGDTDSGDTDTSDTDDTDDTGVVDGAIAVSPSAIDLGVVFVGNRLQEPIVVTNVGEGAVAVTVTVLGGYATAYTFDAYTSAPAPGESATHTLSFTPTTWGDHSVSVVVTDSESGGRVEVPVRAVVQIDADRDGYGSIESGGDDCDDAVASTNPGAADAWYDGVDANCDGADDYDQDGDGYVSAEHGGDDCVDTDATAYPGAPDTWYDGVDADCAGNDDFDQDADGDSASAYGGTDCDDEDPAVSTRATETWYDGIDTNCDGADDYDRDGDGYRSDSYGGDDCNDTASWISPGAAETWYDGVDSDCSGGSDYDQDGDGVDYPTDCDDTDATVSGPTTETVNGVDDDCDGLVDEVVIDDLGGGVLYGASSSAALGDRGTLAMGADVTGDGAGDVLVTTAATSYGNLWVVDGATTAAAAGLVTTYDTAEFSGESAGSGYYYEPGWVSGPMDDVDGDGTADVAFPGGFSYYGYEYGRAYLFDGGSGISGSVSSSGYAYRISADESYSYEGTRQIALGDMDGDGLADLAVGSYLDSRERDSYCGSVAIFDAGSALGSDSTIDIDDDTDRVYGTDDNDYVGYSVVMGDLTDDGYADAIVGATGYDGGASGGGAVFVLAGASSLSWDTEFDDAADLIVEGTSSLALGEDPLAHPGDVDGDGALDLGLASEDSGDVWLFLGAPSGTVSIGDADHNFSGTAGSFGSMLVLDSDLDGDGADDVAIGSDNDDTAATDAGAVYVFRWSTGWASTLGTSDASTAVLGTGSYTYLGAGGAGGADLDGDGLDDLLAGEPGNDTAASNAGAVWVMLGR